MFPSLQRFAVLSLASLALIALSTAAKAQSLISKSQREVVVLQADLGGDHMYEFIEDSGVNLAVNRLSPAYNRVRVVRDGSASLNGLVAALGAATSVSTVRAVDLVIMTHGSDSVDENGWNEWMVFSNDEWRSTLEVRDRLLSSLTTSQRAKLRMVFSTACYSSSHRNQWIQAGFKCASGSAGVYADSAASFDPFLVNWAAGANAPLLPFLPDPRSTQTFQVGVNAANAADPLRNWDNAARAYYYAIGRPDVAADINSWRHTSFSSNAARNLTVSKMF
jgi:hypothetical protein